MQSYGFAILFREPKKIGTMLYWIDGNGMGWKLCDLVM